MLYQKNAAEKLDDALFQNPTSEYRGAPFWAWNCKLSKEILLEQIEALKQMGFGGFHMHSRSGMATPYLSDEFMSLVTACIQKAEDENMLAWLYDEDRWPSGTAGGKVTKDPCYRQKYLYFTMEREENTVSPEEGYQTGNPYLIGCYDIVLNASGELDAYRKIDETEAVQGEKWYAYIKTPEPSGWVNNQTDVDTMDKKAIDRFLKVTHERYKEYAGDKFGKSVPAIFTDEPRFAFKTTLPFADSKQSVTLPWTTDFAQTFQNTYGFDILKKLPELIWNLPQGKISQARYYFHDHACERFASAFADNYGSWCKKNNLLMTGHLLMEEHLGSQTQVMGEAMRFYRGFGLPGIDLLCNNREFSTAKQAQSAAHQFGREGVLSELYGVTNWDFDFRGHKFQGDWQAALGITVRVPHLAWVSMKGSAKRDYPASISYQSPWYKEYRYVEDHFARLNTALTRGKPVADVAVIHPIESYWLHWGPSDSSASLRQQMEENFENVIKWLLSGLIDFDFISESLLPSQCGEIGNVLPVGEMQYKTVIVPNCETLRGTTLKILEQFHAKGGKVIFMGEPPKYIDGAPSNAASSLYDSSRKVQFTKLSLLKALEQDRRIDIKGLSGERTDSFLYTMRHDGNTDWLFIAHMEEHQKDLHSIHKKDIAAPQDTIISIKGEFYPKQYDTITGEIKEVPYSIKNGCTIIPYTFYDYNSLLLSLSSANDCPKVLSIELIEQQVTASIDFRKKVRYHREEPNVLLLDMAEYSLDGSEYQPCEEILRIDAKLRELLQFPAADGHDIQPWAIPEEKIEHYVYLKFIIQSEIEADVDYAFEEAEEIYFNGEPVMIHPNGYYVDHDIHKLKLPRLIKGKNELIVKMPISKRISLEPSYLLGDFNVRLEGCDATITAPSQTIGFGSITEQGMPFYGGNIIYELPLETSEACDIQIRANHYRGSLIKAELDSGNTERIVYPPYLVRFKDIAPGKHMLKLTLYGNRHNTFGGLHNLPGHTWAGPSLWYTKDDQWCYEYRLKETGILSSPVIEYKK